MTSEQHSQSSKDGSVHLLDDYPIREIPQITNWSENFAIAFVDPTGTCSLLYQCGRLPYDPTTWRETIGITIEGRRVIYAKNFGRAVSLTAAGASLSKFEIVEPGTKLRLHFDGPVLENTVEYLQTKPPCEGPRKRCKVDLTFMAVAPLWNMRGDSQEASSIAGSLHTEQLGRAEGTIEYDGKLYRMDNGFSVRDHSRGVREISSYRSHYWLNGVFPGGRAFHFYAMQSQDGPIEGMSCAVVYQDQKHYPARLSDPTFMQNLMRGNWPDAVTLESDAGEMHIAVEQALTDLPMSIISPFELMVGSVVDHPAALDTDQAVRLRWDDKVTIGWRSQGFAAKPF